MTRFRLALAALAALAGSVLVAAPAAPATAAGTTSVVQGVFNGDTATCARVLPASVCGDVVNLAGFGEGATGWPGHSNDWGGPFVEPASFGFYANGYQYNVYESLSETLPDCVRWFLPAGVGVSPDLYAAGIAIYNPAWIMGRGVIVPNDSGAPPIL